MFEVFLGTVVILCNKNLANLFTPSLRPVIRHNHWSDTPSPNDYVIKVRNSIHN